MIVHVLLIAITILGVAYYSLDVGLTVGDLVFQLKVAQLGLILFLLFGSYVIMRKMMRRILTGFQWYRDYLESFNPSKAILMVVYNKLNINKDVELNYKQLSHDKQVYVELIKFLLGKQINSNILKSSSNGPTLSAIYKVEQEMAEKSYVQAVTLLKYLFKQYGYLPWIYKNLRTCYLETRDYEALEGLNAKATAECLGEINRNEAKLIMLREELSLTKDTRKKIQIMEKIYQSFPEDMENITQYLAALQNLGQFDKGIAVIKDISETNSPKLIQLAWNFVDTQDPAAMFELVSKMEDSLVKQVLLIKLGIRVNKFEIAESNILKVAKTNLALAKLLELEIYSKLGDIHNLNKTINYLSEANLEISLKG